MHRCRNRRVTWSRGPNRESRNRGSWSPGLAVAVLFVLTVGLNPATAHEESPETSNAPSAESKAPSPIPVDWDEAEATGAQAKPPEVPCIEITDPETLEECWTAHRAYFSYYEAGFEHRRDVFWWQHVSTRIIFAVVLMLVAAGIYFAWVQFQLDVRRSAESGEAEHRDDTELELATSGIKVRSSVLGVIILALSLVFFYLYLVHVYPITELL